MNYDKIRELKSARQIYPLYTMYKRDIGKMWFITKFTISGEDIDKYQIFAEGDFIGKQYSKMEEVIDKSKSASNIHCHAIKVTTLDGKEGYICPTDKEQNLLDTPDKANILGSFLYCANNQITKYIDTVGNLYYPEIKKLDLDIDHYSRLKELGLSSSYENGNICSPIDMGIDISKYDSSTCQMLADCFYKLLAQYEWQIKESFNINKKITNAMLTDILPKWEFITIGDLTAINEKVSGKNNGSVSNSAENSEKDETGSEPNSGN